MEDKLYSFSDKIFIANAFYATQEVRLSYEKIQEFKIMFYKIYTQRFYKYVMFSNSEGNFLDIYDHLFVKENDGILCCNDLDEEFINEVNDIYPQAIQDILSDVRDLFIEKQKKLRLKK